MKYQDSLINYRLPLRRASHRLIKLNNKYYREALMIRGKISGKFPGEISQKFLLRPRYVGMDTGLLTERRVCVRVCV